MQIEITPQRSDAVMRASASGDVLTINGEDFDFGPLPEGYTLPQEAVSCPYVLGTVTRRDGVIRLRLILPYRPGKAPVVTQLVDGDGWTYNTEEMDNEH